METFNYVGIFVVVVREMRCPFYHVLETVSRRTVKLSCTLNGKHTHRQSGSGMQQQQCSLHQQMVMFLCRARLVKPDSLKEEFSGATKADLVFFLF